MHVLVTCKYKKDRIENNRKGGDILFPIISHTLNTFATATTEIRYEGSFILQIKKLHSVSFQYFKN